MKHWAYNSEYVQKLRTLSTGFYSKAVDLSLFFVSIFKDKYPLFLDRLKTL